MRHQILCSASATNRAFIRLMGITHVLNTAEGSRYGQVDTGHAYYRDMPNVRYMGFPMTDQPSTDISRYFYIAAKFIDNAISSGGEWYIEPASSIKMSGRKEYSFAQIFKLHIILLLWSTGKVLVHCMMGISRSSTCAIAYLMINRKMSASDAIRTVRLRRDIRPNDGFLQQLADLDNELRRERQYAYWLSYKQTKQKQNLQKKKNQTNYTSSWIYKWYTCEIYYMYILCML